MCTPKRLSFAFNRNNLAELINNFGMRQSQNYVIVNPNGKTSLHMTFDYNDENLHLTCDAVFQNINGQKFHISFHPDYSPNDLREWYRRCCQHDARSDAFLLKALDCWDGICGMRSVHFSR